MTNPISPQNTEILKKNFIWAVIIALAYCVLSLYQDQKSLYMKIQEMQDTTIKQNTEAIIKNTEVIKNYFRHHKSEEDQE